MKLFVYHQAEKPIHDTIEGFYGTTPFGGDGIKNHFSITDDPKQADLFWMGQYKDTESWKLHPNRFNYLLNYPEKHAVDLEGDWRDLNFPDWLHECCIITGNWNLDKYGPDRKIFVRPIMSPLLMQLVRNPLDYEAPKGRKFWFKGQRDSLGVRERLRQALEISGIPYEFEFNDKWMVYASDDDPMRVSYIESMKRNAFALCPRGEGQATCRFYEAVAFGRTPILIANNVLAGNQGWPWVISENDSVGSMAHTIRAIYESKDGQRSREHGVYARAYFRDVIQPYFHDPTKTFLDWREKEFTVKE